MPTILKDSTDTKNSGGTKKVPSGTFTENLLRDILSLKPCHQLDLVSRLADPNDSLTKNQFKHLARAYKYREQMFWYCHDQLGKVPKEDREYYCEVFSGRYDTVWKDAKKTEKRQENGRKSDFLS